MNRRTAPPGAFGSSASALTYGAHGDESNDDAGNTFIVAAQCRPTVELPSTTTNPCSASMCVPTLRAAACTAQMEEGVAWATRDVTTPSSSAAMAPSLSLAPAPASQTRPRYRFRQGHAEAPARPSDSQPPPPFMPLHSLRPPSPRSPSPTDQPRIHCPMSISTSSLMTKRGICSFLAFSVTAPLILVYVGATGDSMETIFTTSSTSVH